MRYRILLIVPEAFRVKNLSAANKAKIDGAVERHVFPMPLTQAVNGEVVLDAIVNDTFVKTSIPNGAELIGAWDEKGREIVPLNGERFLPFLPPTYSLNDKDEVIETPAVLHEPHKWAGWPDILNS